MQSAKGITVKGCKIKQNVVDENFLIGIRVGTADNDCDGLSLIDNLIIGVDAANTNGIKFMKHVDDVVVSGNRIVGTFAEHADNEPIAAPNTANLTAALIEKNYISSTQTVVCNGIAVKGTNTGVMKDNVVDGADVAAETPFLGPGLGMMNNLYSGVKGTASGYLSPAADS